MNRTCDVLIIGGGVTGAGLLRDLSMRGLDCLLVEQRSFGSGTSGRYHGLLHSGARYVVNDPVAARECVAENAILRRIASAWLADTGGWFVATRDDPEAYVTDFPLACAAAGVECEQGDVAELLKDEPRLNRRLAAAFRVLDGALDPLALIAANLAAAEALGGRALEETRVVSFERRVARIVRATVVVDAGSSSIDRVTPRLVVSAAGPWAGVVAAMAGATVAMAPTRGAMLVLNRPLTASVINRCHFPADGDIVVPINGMAILGTTDDPVVRPDADPVTDVEVQALLAEGTMLFPGLRLGDVRGAYAGVRPLLEDESASGAGDPRARTRTHRVIDHEVDAGLANFVSIAGGKLTTYRLMAEETADLVCRKLGVEVACSTAEVPLPDAHALGVRWQGAEWPISRLTE